MAKSLGKAIHRYADNSEHVLRVEIERKAAPGSPACIGQPDYFRPHYINPSERINIGGARQARVLASLLTLLADRLEARGDL